MKFIYSIIILLSTNLFLQAQQPVFRYVEEFPEFPGGEDAMYGFIAKTAIYPTDAYQKSKQGKVFVEFIVEANGQLNEIKVVKGIFPSLDSEAVRIIKAMPKWKPGKQNGEAVRVYNSIPIEFILGDETNDENIPKALMPVFLLVNDQKMKEANEKLDELMEAQPSNLDFLSTKAIFYLQANRLDEACQMMTKVRALGDEIGYTSYTTRKELVDLMLEYCKSE
jgi:protein TonB